MKPAGQKRAPNSPNSKASCRKSLTKDEQNTEATIKRCSGKNVFLLFLEP